MSGEFFNATYKNNSTDSNNSIGASGYLKNNNKKVIYFVLDYKKHIAGVDFNEIADQSTDIQLCVTEIGERWYAREYHLDSNNCH